MFTGIVSEIGSITHITHQPGKAVLRVGCKMPELVLGESIAVHGVCLTVNHIDAGGFYADASAETLACTTLGQLRGGDKIHLERALLSTDRLGGHVVTGHVDGVGELMVREPAGDALRLQFKVPDALAKYIASKGCIAIDGTSLTVNGVKQNTFDVMLVPYTLQATCFNQYKVAHKVNLETDVLAKYVLRALEQKDTA